MKKISLLIFLIFTLSSCYEETVIKETGSDIFELKINSSMEDLLYESRDSAFSLKSSDPFLFLNDEQLNLDDIRIRGKNALSFRRKSFSVFLDEPTFIKDRYNKSVKKLERFKLISLAMDYTYIENRVSFGLLQKAGLMPLFFKFVELEINGSTQGIYLLIEDPEQYFIDCGSEYILRRGYRNYISDSEYKPVFYHLPETTYSDRYYEIYQNLKLNSEEGIMYKRLSERLNLQAYYRKIAIDFLLQNGDYTDEIFFYSQVKSDSIEYQIIPWDYDDIFSSAPHEVGRDWGTGKIFGSRTYSSMEDIYNDVGDKLIFSIEDDLDYVIAKDSSLYTEYLLTCKALMNEINEDLIDQIFEETRRELSPFYEIDAIVNQSTYDLSSTTKDLWLSNMEEKKIFLKKRLRLIKTKLANENQ